MFFWQHEAECLFMHCPKFQKKILSRVKVIHKRQRCMLKKKLAEKLVAFFMYKQLFFRIHIVFFIIPNGYRSILPENLLAKIFMNVCAFKNVKCTSMLNQALAIIFSMCLFWQHEEKWLQVNFPKFQDKILNRFKVILKRRKLRQKNRPVYMHAHVQ